MTTLANTQPCGSCLCCKAGTHCARVLILDFKAEAEIALVRRVIGEPTGRAVNLKLSGPDQARRADPPEPTVTATCSKCGEPWEVFAFVASTLELRGHSIPRMCPYCARQREERADLR